MSYRYYRRGEYLPMSLVIGAYFIDDFLDLGLGEPGYGQRWVRYGTDAVLIDSASGRVIDVVYGVYDDGSNVAPPPDDFSDGGASEQIYENWNTGACGVTDTATLDLDAPLRLDRVDLWVNWRGGEQSTSYRVFYNGEDFGGGTLERADCDPYQTSWCAASDSPAASLEPGRYVFQIDHPAICQNSDSGGSGMIRAWGRWR
jgi:hypothetical protein